MILSVSRRTDVPAFYMEWFAKRIREGFLQVKNPFNPQQIRTLSLAPDDVECIVFWSKHPRGLLTHAAAIADYAYYIQYTLNAYGKDVEANLPALAERIELFQKLSNQVGPGRIIWRYDPILLSPSYSAAFHAQAFEGIAAALAGYTKKVTISFLDLYAKNNKTCARHALRRPTDDERHMLARLLADIACQYGLVIQACAEEGDFSSYGIGKARCVDGGLLRGEASGYVHKKDPNQRPACLCDASIDVGAYNTCLHGCLYCYANQSTSSASLRHLRHDPASPLLVP